LVKTAIMGVGTHEYTFSQIEINIGNHDQIKNTDNGEIVEYCKLAAFDNHLGFNQLIPS